MECKEEGKKDTKAPETFEPMLDLKLAMEQLKFDPQSPDFSEEAMIAKFQQLSDDPNIHFF